MKVVDKAANKKSGGFLKQPNVFAHNSIKKFLEINYFYSCNA
jgi:hypothetical protein